MANKGRQALLPLAEITVSPDLQMRAGGLDSEHAADIAEAVKARKPIERVRVWVVDGVKYLVDGFHRHDGHRLAGKTHIPALIWNGTWDQAVVAAATANATKYHVALKRTRADKRRAVEMLLGVHPEWSDRKVAAEAQVGKDLVAEVRAAVQVAEQTPGKRVGRDGKEYERKAKAEPVGLGVGDWRATPLTEFLSVTDTVWKGIEAAEITTAGELWDSLMARAGSKKITDLGAHAGTTIRDLIDELKQLQAEPDPEPARTTEPKLQRPGQATFVWADFDGPFGQLVKSVDSLKRRFPEAKASPELLAVGRLLDELLKSIKPLRKRLGA